MGGNTFDAKGYADPAPAPTTPYPDMSTGVAGNTYGLGNALTEQMIIDAGADKAPRITPQHIQDQIAAEYFATGEQLFNGAPIAESLKRLTICVLVTKNGATFVGSSACVSAANFRADIGIKLAREDAMRDISKCEGYHLLHKLAATPPAILTPDPPPPLNS